MSRRIKIKSRQTGFSFLITVVLIGIYMLVPNGEGNEQEDIPFVTEGIVDYVIDGDTAWIIMDGVKEKVRFIGVNTPERDEANYSEATEYTRDMIEGETVYLEQDISDVDQYDRKLRYIWLEKPQKNSVSERDEKLFNGMLLLEGHAKIVVYQPDTKYLEYFESLVGEFDGNN